MLAIKRERGTLNEYSDWYKGVVFVCNNNKNGEILKKKINQNTFIGEVEQPPNIEDIALVSRLCDDANTRLAMIQNMSVVVQNIDPMNEQQQMLFKKSSTIESGEKIVAQKAMEIGKMQVMNENKQMDNPNKSKTADYSPGIMVMRKPFKGLEDEEEEMVIDEKDSKIAKEKAKVKIAEKNIEANLTSSSVDISQGSSSVNKRRSKSRSSHRRKLDKVYAIEEIRDERIVGTDKQYLIKWANYTELTWEPAENFAKFNKLIANFEKLKKKSVSDTKKEEQMKSPMKGTKRKSVVMSTNFDSESELKYQRIYIGDPKNNREELAKKLHNLLTPTTRGRAANQLKESSGSATPTKKEAAAKSGEGGSGIGKSKNKDKQPQESDDNEMVPETPQIPAQNINNKDFVMSLVNQQQPLVQNIFGFQRGLQPKAVLKMRKGLHGVEEFLVEYKGESNTEWVLHPTFQESGPLARSLQLKFLTKCVGKIFSEMSKHEISVDEYEHTQE